MEHFHTGMNLKDVITAKNMNEIADMVNRSKYLMTDIGGLTQALQARTWNEIRVYVSSQTVPSLGRFACVQISDGLILEPSTCDTFDSEIPSFIVNSVVTGSDKPFAILQEPVSTGGVARAVMTGVTLAKIDITNSSYQYASPKVGNSGLMETTETGPARILWRGGTSGEQLCVLQLGLPVQQSTPAPTQTGLPFTFRQYVGSDGYDHVYIYGGNFNRLGTPDSIEDDDRLLSSIGKGEFIYLHHNTNSHSNYFGSTSYISYGNGPMAILGQRLVDGSLVCYNNHYPILINTQFFSLCPKYNLYQQ